MMILFPAHLVTWCQQCDLLQLQHSYPPEEMYGENYGYRSGLNQSMIDHLAGKANDLSLLAKVKGDNILDIGSNDGALLSKYSNMNLQRVGIDPTAEKFQEYYEDGIRFPISSLQKNWDEENLRSLPLSLCFMILRTLCHLLTI